MADNLDEVFAEPLEAVEPAPTQEMEPAPEPTPEPVAEAAPEPQPEAAQPQHPQAGYVPIDAMLTEREKRQALERRVAEFEAQQVKQRAVPDPFDDPAGFQAHQSQELGRALYQERFATSEYLATEKFGDEAVKAAAEWAENQVNVDPTFAQRFSAERFPMMWIVQQHKRDALLNQIGDPSKLDTWFEQEAAKRGFARASAPAPVAQAAIPQQASPPVKVPRSLASQGSAPSDLRHTATGALAGVDSLFS